MEGIGILFCRYKVAMNVFEMARDISQGNFNRFTLIEELNMHVCM